MGDIIEPVASPAAAEPFRERLADCVRAFASTGFAVVDGGLYDDLPGLLRREGLMARSLFLDHADAEAERAGPWLVSLAQSEGAPDAVFALVGGRPAVVFWSCEDGEMALHRHLRTLNLARIPAWAAAGEAAPRNEVKPDRYETVTFRHWDPSVLGALLPALDATQFRRIIGPADEMALWTEDHGGLKRVVPDPAWPAAPAGLRPIETNQIQLLTPRRGIAAQRRIALYLRDVALEQTKGVSDDGLLHQVRYSEEVGQRLGLRTERANAQWAYLMVVSKGAVANQPEITRFIRESGQSPDHQVDAAMRQLIAAAREQGRVG